ncbi:S41 family peptidase [Spirosoma sp. KNUC1025]|uniref:S41 family peptidase n=1 Tax=Spirosoma sp. KNUC1025 TaxID=2894082 RepID=UPI003866DEA8|nr:S41 family peptidase [Spirosoma sp. KNUC1025]
MSLIENHSIHRKTIDWPSFKQQVDNKAQGAQTIADTYPAIQLALTLLGDNYSSYMTASGTVLIGERTVHCTDSAPTEVPANSNIGYVKITSFSEGGASAVNFAQSIQTIIKQADTDSIRGWIVDLRGNLGGNMWPMLAGVDPILGDGIVGYFVDPDRTTSPWSNEAGMAKAGQNVLTKVETPYTLRKANPKVAVLTNLAAASSGEAIAIAFKGRPNTRSFGTPTCGLSTGNVGFKLSNSANLTLTEVTMADRTKTPYGKSIQPDDASYSSTAVDRAIAWLLQ